MSLLFSFMLVFCLYGFVVVGFVVLPTVSIKNQKNKVHHHHHHGATANNFAEAFLMSQQPKGIEQNTIQEMIQRQGLRENFVVVVTGATGGIGSQICQTVLTLNGLIFAVDFDEAALLELQLQNPERIRTVVSNFKDLNSVSDAADTILNQVSQVDILVNNAGICYLLDDDEVEKAGMSAQGYDDCFQINYLSHFLLTEKLLKKMNPATGRVVQVSSGLSWSVDGSGLVPSPSSSSPAASFSGPNRLPRHVSMAYGNSKLAQIWHATQLNRLGVTTAVCACPSWCATGIGGKDTEEEELLEKLAFPTYPQNDNEVAGPGVRSVLNAMFVPTKELNADILTGKKLIGNSKVLDIVFPQDNTEPNPILSLDVVDVLFGREKVVKAIAAFAVLIFQRWNHDDLILQKCSFESLNKQGQIALYEWSESAVREWLTNKEKQDDEQMNVEPECDDDLPELLVV